MFFLICGKVALYGTFNKTALGLLVQLIPIIDLGWCAKQALLEHVCNTLLCKH